MDLAVLFNSAKGDTATLLRLKHANIHTQT